MSPKTRLWAFVMVQYSAGSHRRHGVTELPGVPPWPRGLMPAGRARAGYRDRRQGH
jgi:hypothetical protein